MKRFNNKKRQNAVFCLKQERIFARFLRGQNIPNGYVTKSTKVMLIPKAIQDHVKVALMEFRPYEYIAIRPVEKYEIYEKS